MISKILRDIPWLPIDMDIDIDKLQQEYKFVSENYKFEKYSGIPDLLENGVRKEMFYVDRHGQKKKVREKYAETWSGISLISSDGSLYKDFGKYAGKGIEDYHLSTELENCCEYHFELIDLFSARKSRCRIMRISPKTSLLFHSHVLDYGQPEETLTIQIPIEMPDNFEYCVVEQKDFIKGSASNAPDDFDKIHRSKLDVGKAYVFNSYHYHNVFNYSDTYRASIMLYCSLNDENIKQLIEKSLIKEGLYDAKI